jgi:NDP-sugar pyrophosphorylase family protein
MNIIIPIASPKFKDESDSLQYPLPLIEVQGKTLIEYALEAPLKIKGKNRFVFILKEEDCNLYHFDRSLRLLIPDSKIVVLKNQTRGAVCSILMGIDHFVLNDETLVINFDQLLDYDFNLFINDFRQKNADGGLVTFQSVHPRWSYVRIVDDKVMQTAEKNPISNHAIAGIYYFKRTSDMIEAAYNVIRHDDNYNEKYYTSSIYNQLILKGKSIYFHEIPNCLYHSFYSSQKVRELEDFLRSRN